jgi:hypothetical protein
VSFWSGAKALRAEDLGLEEGDIAEAYKLGKKMLIPAEVIRKFRSIESKARRLVETNSFPFPIGNARFIPKRRFVKILDELRKCQACYDRLVDDLVANYDKYRGEMIPIYQTAAEKAYAQRQPETAEFGPDFDIEAQRNEFVQSFMRRIESFYPDADTLRSKFSLGWDVYEIALPRMRQGDAQKISDDQSVRDAAEREYRDQVREKIDGFVNDAVKVLRQQTVEICSRVKDNIVNGRIIKETTIDSLKNFVERFKSLNFIGDYVLENRLDELRKELLETHDAQQFREEVELKEELNRHLGELMEMASNMTDINSITGEYNRKITWDDTPAMTLKKESVPENVES